MESILRPLVNAIVNAKDSYSALKRTAIVLLLLKLVMKLHRIHKRQGLKEFLVRFVLPYARKVYIPGIGYPLQDRLDKDLQEAPHSSHVRNDRLES